MNERIKKLRKHLKLTQEQFAARIGVKRAAICNYEIGRNDPVDSVVSLICREFRVNEIWLRTGEGDMFIEDDNDFFDSLAQEYGLNDDSITAVKIFSKLPPASRQAILDYVKALADAICTKEQAADPISVDDAEELYKKSLSPALDPDASASPTIAATGDEAV